MINFELRYDEHTAKWQMRPTGNAHAGGSGWGPAMRLAKLAQALHAEVATVDEDKDPRWSKPIDHSVRSKSPKVETRQAAWEIKGGKVQRIAYDAQERRQQDLAELLAIMEEGE